MATLFPPLTPAPAALAVAGLLCLAAGLAARPALLPAAEGPPALSAILSDPEALAEGKRTFSVHCSRCHGITGHGGQSTGGGGPSLRDDEWLHGSSYAEMVGTVAAGVRGTLMRSWIRDLGAERVRQVVAYVYSFRLEDKE